MALALFFFSCEDESSFLGFRKQPSKTNVTFVELPVTSSVVLLDSFRTANYSGEFNRWLVGNYTDDLIGTVSTSAYTTYFTTTADTLRPTATYDSVSIELRYDLYTYGSQSATPQTISIHELTDVMDSTRIYNKSVTAYNPTPIGSKDVTIDPVAFKKYIDDEKDTTITLRMTLSWEFGKRIFDEAITYRNSKKQDTTFIHYPTFIEEFKGIAIVASNSDKVIGFRPSGSRMTIHYHTTTDTLGLVMGLIGRNYSRVELNTGGALAGLTAYHEDFFPADETRYVQGGTGIVTKIDLSEFYNFVDADSNAQIMINEAELRLGEIQPPSGYTPINTMYLYAMNENSRFKRVKTRADTVLVNSYNQFLVVDAGSALITPAGEGSQFQFSRASDEDVYRGFMTRFAQQMTYKDNPESRVRYFALFSANPQGNKSVNRIVFPADALKLRVYYTRLNN